MRTIKINFLVSICCMVSLLTYGQSVVNIGSNREIFIDSHLIDKLNGVQQVMHHPRNEGIVLKFSKPWEGNFSAYCTIMKDEKVYRAYYRGVPSAGKDGNAAEVTCYAESSDGVNWIKPNLGIYEINNTKDNNVILANAAPVTHNFSPFIDKNPNALKSQKYKALGGTKENGLIYYASPDGIHWAKMQESAVFTKGIFDSQNVSFWSESEKQYICYFRTWSEGGYKGFRSVSRTTSKDFMHWTDPEPMTFGDTPFEHLYTQQTSPYFRASHIYIAIGARFMPNRQVVSESQAHSMNVNPKYYKDCSDAVIMSSRGGNNYERTFMESFIRPGIGLQKWVSRSNYPALNVVQTSDEEMSIYVNEDYAQPSAHIKRYSLRLDGFASLSAKMNGGEIITKPFTFKGEELEINYSTSAAGSIKIEIQDENGTPIPGYSLENCEEIIGNEIKRIVTWSGIEKVAPLSSKKVRLHIVMKDADLYAFKFN